MRSSRAHRCKNEIGLATADLPEMSVEVARLWIEDRGTSTCLVNARRLAEPDMFGTLLFDAMHAAAKAFSDIDGITEVEALGCIWRGFDRERISRYGARQDLSKLGSER